MDDDDYYYDDDYGDYYGEVEETWETPLQAKYGDAKAVIDSNPAESIRLLTEVVAEDPQQGLWTFKCLKKLARASRNAQRYDEMMSYYRRFATFESEEVDAASRLNAMSKFVGKVLRLPREHRLQAIDVTLAEAVKDMNVFGSLWLATITKKAAYFIEAEDWSGALPVLQEALAWCSSDRVAGNEAHLTTIYAQLLEVYNRTGQFPQARETYFAAMEMDTAGSVSVPSRVTASVLQWGGHMFMRDGDWHAAHRAFQVAFSFFKDSGDARALSALKFAVLADMLCGSPIDHFAVSESVGGADAQAVRPVARLLSAFLLRDIPGAIATIQDEASRDFLGGDPLVAPYLAPLLQRLRLNVLVHYVSSFSTVRLRDVARRLCLESEEEAEDLCSFAILHHLISASVDGVRNMLCVHTATRTTEHRRAEALFQWASSVGQAAQCGGEEAAGAG